MPPLGDTRGQECQQLYAPDAWGPLACCASLHERESHHVDRTLGLVKALVAGVAPDTLGGLLGLGGAEFRLPPLIGLFGFSALPAVMLNKTMSLVVGKRPGVPPCTDSVTA
ncbi:hypothetical protein QTH97_24415 [Variovorax sp. J22R24]|uniref:hypothetical protein n=1 Tax=Variovorax gracilis TaxID=3053502 RepID=UPI002578B741|nr:hypothetical protein [Variovorax sp. J22R24]MDM0108115.1 hypothetical protein [Variovorax sp. J22R24]